MCKFQFEYIGNIFLSAYVDELMEQVTSLVELEKEKGKVDTTPDVEVPPPLCSTVERPSKEKAIAEHFTRF